MNHPNQKQHLSHSGNYQFKRMPFGLQGAPATYQNLMCKLLRNILFSYAHCYLDDILCFSDSAERNCEHLTEILDRFSQAKLRLNPGKCKFAICKVIYLGHVLSTDGISVDKKKVSVIKTFPVPKNAQQLRSLLGICNYYVKMLRRPVIFWLYSCKIWLQTLIDSPICTWWLVELFITKTGNQPITRGRFFNGRRFEQYRSIW